jgi:hypothetical protein
MALRDTARYAFGLVFTRFMALNDDLTIPTPDRIMGGVGPFDFSGHATPAAVPITVKLDNGAEDAQTVDLTAGVADISAVTVAELVARINLAGLTDITASEDLTTGRLLLVYSGTDDPLYMQVYGDCAILALIGQGRGCQFKTTDTLKSLSDTPTQKDSETISTIDANGLDTEILTDGYRKGFSANIVDTAEDFALRALIEGGVYTERDAGPPVVPASYVAPTSESRKIYFYVEAFYKQYERGTQNEGNEIGYVRKFHRSCKGVVGDRTHERAFGDINYAIQGTSYKDESGNLLADTELTEMTVEEYEAYDVYNV